MGPKLGIIRKDWKAIVKSIEVVSKQKTECASSA